MAGIIHIKNKESKTFLKECDYLIEPSESPLYYSISIYTLLNEKFNSLYSNKHLDEFKDSIKFYKNALDKFEEDSKYINKIYTILDNYKNKEMDLIKNAEYISLDFNIKEIEEYIKYNPEILCKKFIFYLDEIDISYLIKLKEIFKNTNNLYFMIKGNTVLINYNDCLNTFKYIEDIALDSKKYNFSPLEQIMYIYDNIRDRIYKLENEDEDKNISRDLSKVILGNKIVCQGYANIFDAVLRILKFNTQIVYLLNEKSGHARNMVQIIDKKYNINGVYYFDTTWDSKKNENDIEFLLSYKYFALTKIEFEKYNKKYIDKRFKCFNDEFADEFIANLNKNGITNIDPNVIHSINYMSEFLYGECLINPIFVNNNPKMFTLKELLLKDFDSKKTIKKVEKMSKYFNNPIPTEILLKALVNVRKIEYYKYPQKYLFDIDTLCEIANKSKWDPLDIIELFFSYFKNYSNYNTALKSQIKNYLENNHIGKEIVLVKLTKTLRNIYDKKNTE